MVWSRTFKRSLACLSALDLVLVVTTLTLAVTIAPSVVVIVILLSATALAGLSTITLIAAHWVTSRIISCIDTHLADAEQRGQSRGEALAYAEILSPGSTRRRHLRSI